MSESILSGNAMGCQGAEPHGSDTPPHGSLAVDRGPDGLG
jgi:hypothetical protein